MINFRAALQRVLLATLVALPACSMTSGTTVSSTSNTFTARLSGASEVPAVKSDASGAVEASLNTETNVLSWTVTYSGLSGPATAGHFHGPAITGQNADVAVPLNGNLASPIKGTATLTAGQVADLMAGKWYLNLHTAANPKGEIRGQVTAKT
jgi:hypothetical protein